MKIALYVRGMGIGGITTFVLELGKSLMNTGHSVTVVARLQGGWWPRLAEYDIPGVLLLPGHWESAFQYTRRLAHHAVAEQYDIVFVNIGPDPGPVMRGLHLWPDSIAAVPVLHNDVARIYAGAQINQSAWNVAVAVSPKMQSAAAAALPGKPILTIPYGIRIPPERQLAARLAWHTPLRLLYVGRLEDGQKGILRLPEILAGCRNQGLAVRLTVIGDGPDWRRLERGFAQQGVADLVEMNGVQPADAVYRAMQTHHTLLMPSNYEGMGLVNLEAQANGCVPVASRLAGITDFAIEEGVSGYLVEAGDIQAYVGAIARLMDAERWQTLSQAGIERAQRLFSVEMMVARYLEMIEQIAAGAYPLAAPRAASARQAQRLFRPLDYVPGEARRQMERLWRRAVRRLTWA